MPLPSRFPYLILSMQLYLLQGILFGFAAAAQPGPLQTCILSQALVKGWKKSLPAAFAPLISDGPIIVVCLLWLSQLPDWFQDFLYIAGGLFILYLSYGAYKAWRNFAASTAKTETIRDQSILKAAFVNALSPGPYIFWSLVTGPILVAGWRKSPEFGFTFMLGFYSTFILFLMLIIILFGTLRNFGENFQRTLMALSAVALLCFGLYQLWLGIH